MLGVGLEQQLLKRYAIKLHTHLVTVIAAWREKAAQPAHVGCSVCEEFLLTVEEATRIASYGADVTRVMVASSLLYEVAGMCRIHFRN